MSKNQPWYKISLTLLIFAVTLLKTIRNNYVVTENVF